MNATSAFRFPEAAAIAAVRRAMRVCQHVQRDLNRLRAMTKDDRSPVTVADYASQAVIARTLAAEANEPFVLVAEESAEFLKQPEHAVHLEAVIAALNDSAVWPGGRAVADEVLAAINLGTGNPLSPAAKQQGFWTLDPVDGTKGFVRGEQYAVALAFIDAGTEREVGGPSFAVMGCPNLPIGLADPFTQRDHAGSIFVARRGGGSWSLPPNEQADAGARLPLTESTSGHVRLAESVDPSHSHHELTQRIMHAVDPQYIGVRLDSQAKYAVVARGQADVYLRLPTKPGYIERIWDHAPGALIAQEAGCIVTDIAGKPLNFTQGLGLESTRGIVCARPEVHARVLKAIREQAPKPLS